MNNNICVGEFSIYLYSDDDESTIRININKLIWNKPSVLTCNEFLLMLRSKSIIIMCIASNGRCCLYLDINYRVNNAGFLSDAPYCIRAQPNRQISGSRWVVRIFGNLSQVSVRLLYRYR